MWRTGGLHGNTGIFTVVLFFGLLTVGCGGEGTEEEVGEEAFDLLGSMSPNQLPPTNPLGWGQYCQWKSLASNTFQEGIFMDGDGEYASGYFWQPIAEGGSVARGLIVKINPDLSVTTESAPEVSTWPSVAVNPQTGMTTAIANYGVYDNKPDGQYGLYQRHSENQWSLLFEGVGRAFDHCHGGDGNIYLALWGHNKGESYGTTIIILDSTTLDVINTFTRDDIRGNKLRCLDQEVYLTGRPNSINTGGGVLVKITSQWPITFPVNHAFAAYHDVAPAKTGNKLLVIGNLTSAPSNTTIVTYNNQVIEKTKAYPGFSGSHALLRAQDGTLYATSDGESPYISSGFSAYTGPQGTAWQPIPDHFDNESLWEKDGLIFMAGSRSTIPPFSLPKNIPGLAVCKKGTLTHQ